MHARVRNSYTVGERNAFKSLCWKEYFALVIKKVFKKQPKWTEKRLVDNEKVKKKQKAI